GFSQPWQTSVNSGTIGPTARFGHSASDMVGAPLPMMPPPVSGVLIFGGAIDPSGRNYTNEVWNLVPEGTDVTGVYHHHFERVTPGVGSENPMPRAHHTAIWDDSQHRMLMYGGRIDDRTIMDDLWELRMR